MPTSSTSTDAQADALRKYLEDWKPARPDRTSTSASSATSTTSLHLLGVAQVGPHRRASSATAWALLARFTNVLADYESVTRRSRRDAKNPGEQVGGDIGGEWFYKNFALLLVNYANGSYDDFDGEEDLRGDGVALGTVHGAKGLEWPIVFLPSLTKGRFPSSTKRHAQEWLVPTTMFDAARYEGTDADERRLFYVALTRARDWVSLSSHRRVNTQNRQGIRRTSPSAGQVEPDRRLSDISGGHRGSRRPTSRSPTASSPRTPSAPQSYLLRNELGFMPPIQSELATATPYTT